MKKATFKGGIHLHGHKERTKGLATMPANVPDKVYIPLSQHTGAPCTPIVQVGDEVKKGQKIGEGKGFVTSPIHASVSGKVTAIETKEHPGGSFVSCIVIENDRQEVWADTVKPQFNSQNLTPEEIRKIVFEAGIVGLGGAAFPSHVKYSPVEGKKAEVVILNGVECEPFITADHRIMLEKPERIVAGLRYIMKAVDCPRGVIAIEDNKPDAIAVMEKIVESEKNISVLTLAEKYPQGSEKQLIYACTQREIPVGGLPLDVGAIVNNVGTAAAVADAIEKGIPLIERIVTLNGDGIEKPANYMVRIGTLIKELIAQSGGYTGEIEMIIGGGPMMGKALSSDEVPIVKGSSGVLVTTKQATNHAKEYNCVRCAKCIDACPAFLEPTTIAKLAKRGLWEDTERNDVLNCIECGSCVYVCPARIPLVQYIRRAKQAIMAARAKAKK